MALNILYKMNRTFIKVNHYLRMQLSSPVCFSFSTKNSHNRNENILNHFKSPDQFIGDPKNVTVTNRIDKELDDSFSDEDNFFDKDDLSGDEIGIDREFDEYLKNKGSTQIKK